MFLFSTVGCIDVKNIYIYIGKVMLEKTGQIPVLIKVIIENQIID